MTEKFEKAQAATDEIQKLLCAFASHPKYQEVVAKINDQIKIIRSDLYRVQVQSESNRPY